MLIEVYPASNPEREILDSYDKPYVVRADGSRYHYDRGRHGGIDLGGPGLMIACTDGTIRRGYSSAYGNWVEIVTADGQGAFYAHGEEIKVSNGQKVKAGTVLGTKGDSGNTTGIHLHFEARRKAGDRWSIFNPFEILERARQEALMALTAEDKDWIKAVVTKSVARGLQAIGWGYNPDDDYVPDDPSWKDATSTYNLKAILGAIGNLPPAQVDSSALQKTVADAVARALAAEGIEELVAAGTKVALREGTA